MQAKNNGFFCWLAPRSWLHLEAVGSKVRNYMQWHCRDKVCVGRGEMVVIQKLVALVFQKLVVRSGAREKLHC